MYVRTYALNESLHIPSIPSSLLSHKPAVFLKLSLHDITAVGIRHADHVAPSIRKR
jgi:hypothetical protein